MSAIPLIADARALAPDPLPAHALRRDRVMAALVRWGRRAVLMLPHRVFAASQAVMQSLGTEGVKDLRRRHSRGLVQTKVVQERTQRLFDAEPVVRDCGPLQADGCPWESHTWTAHR